MFHVLIEKCLKRLRGHGYRSAKILDNPLLPQFKQPAPDSPSTGVPVTPTMQQNRVQALSTQFPAGTENARIHRVPEGCR